MHLVTELTGLDIVLCVDLPFCPVKGQRILKLKLFFGNERTKYQFESEFMLAHIHTYRRPLQKSNKVAKFQHVTSENRTTEHPITSPVRYSFTTEAAKSSAGFAT